MEGREYEGAAALDWSEYTDLSEGSRLDIRYDPGDYSVSKLEKRFKERELDGTSGIQMMFEYLVFMTLMGMIWLGVWYIRGLRPLLRLRREGRRGARRSGRLQRPLGRGRLQCDTRLLLYRPRRH